MMRFASLQHPFRLATKYLFASLGIVAIVVLTAGCASTSSDAQTSLTPSSTTSQTATATETATRELPDLSAEPGWHTALQLGYVSPGVTTSGGTFTATKPYAIIVVCEGTGKVNVDYSPQGSFTFTCGAAQQRNRNQIGSDQHPPAHDTLHVSVTADAGVVWRAVVEVEN